MNLGIPGVGDSRIGPTNVGILSTPFIDEATHTMYVVAEVRNGTDVGLYVNALDIATGQLKYNSPRRMSFVFPTEGVTLASVTGGIQRAGLLVSNGVLYVAVANIVPGDRNSQEGFVQSFNAQDLTIQLGTFQATPGDPEGKGGIWEGGRGLPVDSSGIYFSVAGGAYSGTTGSPNFGSSVVKVAPATLNVQDSFTPQNWQYLSDNNVDPAAGGVTLIPGTQLLVAGGKEGVIYLLDRNNMGRLEGTDGPPVQRFQAGYGCAQNTTTPDCSQTLGTAYWDRSSDGVLYVWDKTGVLRAFHFNGQTFDTTAPQVGTFTVGMTGGPSLSASGADPSSALVWAVTTANLDDNTPSPGTLRAYRADDITQELYNSDINDAADRLGTMTKFAPPVVANGKVYVATQSNAVQVYGLLPVNRDTNGNILSGTNFVTGFALNSPPLRNNFGGFVGMKFTIGTAPVTVTALGRIFVTGNTGTHIVKLVRAADGSDVPGASVSLSMAGGTARQFRYASLAAPVALLANTSYYLVSQEANGGDKWYDYGAISATGIATVNTSIWLNGNTWSPVSGPNSSYVPVTFLYAPPAGRISVTLQTNPLGRSFTVDGTSYTGTQTLYWVPGSTHTIATATQSGGSGTQYVWSSWSDAGALSHSVMPSTPVVYTANFTTQYLLTTNIAPAGSGTVTASPASASGYYDSGTAVQLTAAAIGGSNTFIGWGGDLSGNTNPQNITMSGPRTVTVGFQPPGTGFVTGYALNAPPVRNDFGGFVGMKLTIGTAPVTITALGRVFVNGNTGTHIVKLVRATDGVDVPGASLLISMAGGTAGQFQYSPLPSAVTLPANTSYYLVSEEAKGGDKWYDYGAVSASSIATVNNSVWLNGSTWSLVSGSNSSYVPVSFLYTSSTGTAPVTLKTNPAGTGFVTGVALDAPPVRNDFGGFVGMKLTTSAAPVTVTALGRIFVAGNAGTHVVKLVRAVDGADVPGASVTISMAGGTAGQFQYSALPGAVTLPANTSYYLVSQEANGGDKWYDHGAISVTSIATVNSSVWLNGTAWAPISGPNTSYVPLNFLYTSTTGTTSVTQKPNPTGTNFVTGFALNAPPLRNDFSGFVGMKLTIGTVPVTITALGRIFVAGNTGTHIVKLVRAADGADVPGGSVSISMVGGTAGQFQYSLLATPVTLPANTSYYLVSQEAGGGDKWYDHGTISTTSVGNVSSSVWLNGTTWSPISGPNTSYVPVSFLY